MRVVAVGKSPKNSPEMVIFQRYAERTKLGLVEVGDGRGSALEIKRREGEAILGVLSAGEFVVALDAGGVVADSVAFAGMLGRWEENAQKIAFVIGGAEGLDGVVLGRAQAVWSLGVMTWPHMLARVMVAEQVYRGRMILSGHPYHRAGRP